MSSNPETAHRPPAQPAGQAPDAYKTLGKFASDEIVIKRSRFIGWGAPVNTEEEALAVLERIRSEHAQATHNCYAYRVGFGAETVRFSDDGEPGGTAGKPILDVIQRGDLRNVIIIVTRYFGGTLLGAGGLVRAYSQAAKLAVDAAGAVEMVRHARLTMELDYEWYGRLQHELQERGVIVESSDFEANVTLTALVRLKDADGLIAAVRELTNGRVEHEIVDRVFRAIPVSKQS